MGIVVAVFFTQQFHMRSRGQLLFGAGQPTIENEEEYSSIVAQSFVLKHRV